MQCMGYQLLTGSRLAINQDCDIRVRESANSAKHFLHGRRFTNNFLGRWRFTRQVLGFLFPGKSNTASGYIDKFIEIKGFG